jgi:hypothetical protein
VQRPENTHATTVGGTSVRIAPLQPLVVAPGYGSYPDDNYSNVGGTLGVTVEDLIGVPASRSSGKRGPAPKLQQQLERITHLPEAQQRFVMQMIDTVLQQQTASR